MITVILYILWGVSLLEVIGFIFMLDSGYYNSYAAESILTVSIGVSLACFLIITVYLSWALVKYLV
jgi:hypothetical protein